MKKNANEQCKEIHVCRICFEVETSKMKVISPCKCKGTSAFVHEQCLNQ